MGVSLVGGGMSRRVSSAKPELYLAPGNILALVFYMPRSAPASTPFRIQGSEIATTSTGCNAIMGDCNRGMPRTSAPPLMLARQARVLTNEAKARNLS